MWANSTVSVALCTEDGVLFRVLKHEEKPLESFFDGFPVADASVFESAMRGLRSLVSAGGSKSFILLSNEGDGDICLVIDVCQDEYLGHPKTAKAFSRFCVSAVREAPELADRFIESVVAGEYGIDGGGMIWEVGGIFHLGGESEVFGVFGPCLTWLPNDVARRLKMAFLVESGATITVIRGEKGQEEKEKRY